MKIRHIIEAIESYAPRSFQEKWDNSGLQIALPVGTDECTGVLVCLDVTEGIIAEAVARGCNLVVSHHPLIFKGFKNLTGSTPQQRAALAAVRAGVAVYSAHTSLDSTRGGVSYAMAELLGAEVTSALEPAEGLETVLTVICPRRVSSDVRLLLLDRNAGAPLCAGNVPSEDNTACCSYADCESESMTAPEPDTVPTIDISHEPMCRVEAHIAVRDVDSVVAAVRALPGAAKSVFSTSGTLADSSLGLGVFAVLPGTGMKGADFAARVREAFGCGAMRVSSGYRPDMTVRRIALCGGSGGEFIGKAIAAGVDAYVTADVRYHDFADIADAACAVFDIGHFESESCAKSILHRVITKKIPNFAVYYSEIETNPVKYL